jgi:hypothetical protein
LGLGAASAAAQYVVTHPKTSHNPINLDFLLDPLSKSEFLSFICIIIDVPIGDPVQRFNERFTHNLPWISGSCCIRN